MMLEKARLACLKQNILYICVMEQNRKTANQLMYYHLVHRAICFCLENWTRKFGHTYAGSCVGTTITMIADAGVIIRAYDRTMLVKYNGHVELPQTGHGHFFGAWVLFREKEQQGQTTDYTRALPGDETTFSSRLCVR